MKNLEILGNEGAVWVRKARKKLGDQARAEVDVHCIRVGNLCYHLAHLGGFSQSQINRLTWAGYLHDLGKFLVAPEVLFKPGALSSEDMAIIRRHPSIGAERYSKYARVTGHFDAVIYRCILQHHERVDGQGYPNGLCSDDVCPAAQFVSLADFIEALSSKRCYRSEAFGFERIVEMVSQERSRAWDAKVVDLFLDNAAGFNLLLQAGQKVLSQPGNLARAEVA